MENRYWDKDPIAELDYTAGWDTWLTDGEIISAVEWTVPTGLTKITSSNTETRATIWLSGGTLGTQYAIVCKVTTDAGRTDERTLFITIKDR